MAENSNKHRMKNSHVTKLNYCMTRASDRYLYKESHNKYKKYPNMMILKQNGKTLKTIINRAANESLGKCTIFSRKKKLKIRDEEVKQSVIKT
jgi:hypothetical protein